MNLSSSTNRNVFCTAPRPARIILMPTGYLNFEVNSQPLLLAHLFFAGTSNVEKLQCQWRWQFWQILMISACWRQWFYQTDWIKPLWNSGWHKKDPRFWTESIRAFIRFYWPPREQWCCWKYRSIFFNLCIKDNEWNRPFTLRLAPEKNVNAR